MKKVRPTDCRRLGHVALTEMRKQAVLQVQAGESPEAVARAMGINRTTIYDWLAAYRKGGLSSLEAKKRGGRKAKLNGKALNWLYNKITMNSPLQMKFAFALWTVDMIAVVIERRFGVKLSRTSVNRLLNQLGLSAQRPLWRAYQQNPEAVERWLKQEFPRIKRLAAKEGAEIFFGDEAGVRSDHHSGTTWGAKGKTPVVSTTGARFGFNMISAISPRGTLRFMVVEGKVGAATFIDFMKRLLVGASSGIYLVVDGHPSHKAKMVSQWLSLQEGRIKLFILPGYSPDLNPDELVWNSLKNQALGRKPHATKEQLKRDAIAHLRKLQKKPALVRSFFQKPSTAYAA